MVSPSSEARRFYIIVNMRTYCRLSTQSATYTHLRLIDNTSLPIMAQQSLCQSKQQRKNSNCRLAPHPLSYSLHWSRKSHLPNPNNLATVILAVPEAAALRIPHWINFFGKSLCIVRKNIQPRIQQCTCCWDFHSPRTCCHALR